MDHTKVVQYDAAASMGNDDLASFQNACFKVVVDMATL